MAEPPAPPDALSNELLDRFQGYDAATLRAVAAYAEELATYQDQQAAEDTEQERDDDLPDEVREADGEWEAPPTATLTTKKINDNHYYYWQWRDGDTIRSEYICPVNPTENA